MKLTIHFWMFTVSFCPSIEKSIKKHPFLDDFDAISQIIQKWMIVGANNHLFLEAEPTSLQQWPYHSKRPHTAPEILSIMRV